MENLLAAIFVFLFYKWVRKKTQKSSSESITLIDFITLRKSSSLSDITISSNSSKIIFLNKEKQSINIPQIILDSNTDFYKYLIVSEIFSYQHKGIFHDLRYFILKNIVIINFSIAIILIPSFIGLPFPLFFYLLYLFTLILCIFFVIYNQLVFGKKAMDFYKANNINISSNKLHFFIAENLPFILYLATPGYAAYFLISLFRFNEKQ